VFSWVEEQKYKFIIIELSNILWFSVFLFQTIATLFQSDLESQNDVLTVFVVFWKIFFKFYLNINKLVADLQHLRFKF